MRGRRWRRSEDGNRRRIDAAGSAGGGCARERRGEGSVRGAEGGGGDDCARESERERERGEAIGARRAAHRGVGAERVRGKRRGSATILSVGLDDFHPLDLMNEV